MLYLDARIRVPAAKLGQFITDLPEWAQLVGVDKLTNLPTLVKHTESPEQSNKKYSPRLGSVTEQVLIQLQHKPMAPPELIRTLKAKKAAIHSAVATLTQRGLIIKQKDKTYVNKK